MWRAGKGVDAGQTWTRLDMGSGARSARGGRRDAMLLPARGKVDPAISLSEEVGLNGPCNRRQ